MNARTGVRKAIHRLRVVLIAVAGSMTLASTLPAQQAEPGHIVASTPPTRVPATQKSHEQSEGERVFAANCSRCHTAPDGFSQRISGTVVRHMRVRASLSEQDEKALLDFFNPQ